MNRSISTTKLCVCTLLLCSCLFAIFIDGIIWKSQDLREKIKLAEKTENLSYDEILDLMGPPNDSILNESCHVAEFINHQGRVRIASRDGRIIDKRVLLRNKEPFYSLQEYLETVVGRTFIGIVYDRMSGPN